MTRSPFNDAIRAVAGHAPALVPDEEQPIGSIGIGRGGAAGPPRRESGSEAFNDALPRGARIARSFTVLGGVHLDGVAFDRRLSTMAIGTIAPSRRKVTANSEPLGIDAVVDFARELFETEAADVSRASGPAVSSLTA